MNGTRRTGGLRGAGIMLAVCLGASAVLHIGLGLFVRRLPIPPRTAAPSTPITINYVTRPKTSAVPPVAPDRAPVRPTTAPRPRTAEQQDDPDKAGQVVKLPPTRDEQKPDRARYLSEQAHRTEAERRARRTSSEAAPAHEYLDESTARGEKSDEERAAKEGGDRRPASEAAQAGQEQEEEPELGGSARGWLALWRQAERSPRDDREGGGEGEAEAAEPDGEPEPPSTDGRGEGEGEENGGPRNPAALMPDLSSATRMVGGAPPNDALDLPEGDGTYVNADQWKYASFFNRVSDAIRRNWKPGDVLRRRRDDETVRHAARRVTTLEVTIDRGGRILAVRVHTFSGSEFLDEEALRAARASGPFSHPPQAMFKGQPEFTFRFGFQVDFERRQGPALWFQGFDGAR